MIFILIRYKQLYSFHNNMKYRCSPSRYLLDCIPRFSLSSVNSTSWAPLS